MSDMLDQLPLQVRSQTETLFKNFYELESSVPGANIPSAFSNLVVDPKRLQRD